MPVPMNTILYGISILAGILFVVYGLSLPPGKRAPSEDSRQCCYTPELPAPTDQMLTLELSGDPDFSGNQMQPASERSSWGSTSSTPARTGIFSRTSKCLAGVLSAPFRLMSSGRNLKDGQIPDKPEAVGTVLSPEKMKTEAESAEIPK
jgi:hypothetical protein